MKRAVTKAFSSGFNYMRKKVTGNNGTRSRTQRQQAAEEQLPAENPGLTGDKNQLLLTDKKNQVLPESRGGVGGISFENHLYDIQDERDQKEYAEAVQEEPTITAAAVNSDGTTSKKYPVTPLVRRRKQKQKPGSRPASSVRGSQVLDTVNENSISNSTSYSDLRQDGSRYHPSNIKPRAGYSGDAQRQLDQHAVRQEALQRYAKSEDILAMRRSSFGYGYENLSSGNLSWWSSMTSLRDSVDTLASSMETLTDNMEKLSSRVSLIESGFHEKIDGVQSDMERTNGRIDGLEEVIGETNGRIDEIQDVKGGMRALMDTTNYTRQTLVAVQSRLANLEQTNAEHDEMLINANERRSNHQAHDDDANYNGEYDVYANIGTF